MPPKTYIAIDLKSFYASVECADRGLDPLQTNLVVADESRTEKTICLAVSPSLKAVGVSGRPRLFEVIQKVQEINALRLRKAKGHKFTGKSSHAPDFIKNPNLELDYIVAVPRMARYLEVSSKIYNVYLKFISEEHIHVYSIDEVFIDATPYLQLYNLDGHNLAMKLIREVLKETGITATAGVGTNLYLSKVAMDIVAKHIPPDKDGVRIAELDEPTYRKQLWSHRPLTDFWRLGPGYMARLESMGLYTMGDVARMSVKCEDLLYRMFGINAELLIDHAWGWEPVNIADIKAYKPESKSISTGQVLKEPYDFEKALLATKEMADLLALELVEKKAVTNHISMYIGYDSASIATPELRRQYSGPIAVDHYGRAIPKSATGSEKFTEFTSSSTDIIPAVARLFDKIVKKDLLVRRINLSANNLIPEDQKPVASDNGQLDLFTDYKSQAKEKAAKEREYDREHRLQEAVLKIKKRFGKNSILKGMNLLDGATTIERNQQIGGHRE